MKPVSIALTAALALTAPAFAEPAVGNKPEPVSTTPEYSVYVPSTQRVSQTHNWTGLTVYDAGMEKLGIITGVVLSRSGGIDSVIITPSTFHGASGDEVKLSLSDVYASSPEDGSVGFQIAMSTSDWYEYISETPEQNYAGLKADTPETTGQTYASLRGPSDICGSM